MIYLTCDKCGKTDTYTRPWKGLNLCFDCTIKARHPKTYKVFGMVDGMLVNSYIEANSEAEAMVTFTNDYPNAKLVDIDKANSPIYSNK